MDREKTLTRQRPEAGFRPSQLRERDFVHEEYVLSADAEMDLDAIWDYIAQDSLDAADRWIDNLSEAFEALERNLGLGYRRKDLTSLPVLVWSVGAYLSFIVLMVKRLRLYL